MKSILTRSTVLEILKSSFNRVAHFDYAKKFTENEEDIRASLYRYVRNILDTDSTWRVFLSYSTKEDAESPALYKPDMVFVRGEAEYTVEIFVELKNWPTIDQIERDIEKLVKLKRHFSDDNPELVFFAILGNSFKSYDKQSLVQNMINKFPSEPKLHVFLEKHGVLYKGPWPDPWRQKLRWQ